MQTITVSEIMTPAGKLPSVNLKTGLLDAADALKKSAMNAPVPLLVAVRGEDGKVAGIIGMVDLLRGLNPKYAEKGIFSDMAGERLSKELLGMFVERYKLYHESMAHICRAASECTVDCLLHPPAKEETVEASATLDVAIDLLALRRRDYLLVMDKGAVVGVIDSAGVYDAILKAIGFCPI